MIKLLRRRLAERRLRRLYGRLDRHCQSCPSCMVATFGNRASRRKMHNPKFCPDAHPILLQLDQALVRLHAAYPAPHAKPRAMHVKARAQML